MSMATQFPAREDSTGRVWYRGKDAFGWTNLPEFAHPDYFAPDAPPVVPWTDDPAQPDMSAHAAGDLGTAASVVANTPAIPTCIGCGRYECEGGQECRDATRCPHGFPHEDECGICRAKRYARKRPTTEEDTTTVTEINDVGVHVPEPAARFTPTMNYPLPPEPPRERIVYDGWGRYKLPSPTTGRPTAFTRSTTVAKTLDDTYNLGRWSTRTAVAAVLRAAEAEQAAAVASNAPDGFDVPLDPVTAELAELMTELRRKIADGNDNSSNKVIDRINDLCGGRDAAELGTAVHAWLEAVDLGTVQPRDVPEMFQPYVVMYQSLLARYALVAVPEYVERIVLNDRGEQTIAGTLDRIYLCVTTGELFLGDVKTSKTLEFGYLDYAIQFAVYGYATKILALDASGWEPMPKINQVMTFCVHIPSDQPERGEIATFDMWQGGEGMITALEVRRRRTEAKKTIPYKHAIPIPSPEALRYVEARQAIQNMSDLSQAREIRQQYGDVWDDDLTQFGGVVAGLLHANA